MKVDKIQVKNRVVYSISYFYLIYYNVHLVRSSFIAIGPGSIYIYEEFTVLITSNFYINCEIVTSVRGGTEESSEDLQL